MMRCGTAQKMTGNRDGMNETEPPGLPQGRRNRQVIHRHRVANYRPAETQCKSRTCTVQMDMATFVQSPYKMSFRIHKQYSVYIEAVRIFPSLVQIQTPIPQCLCNPFAAVVQSQCNLRILTVLYQSVTSETAGGGALRYRFLVVQWRLYRGQTRQAFSRTCQSCRLAGFSLSRSCIMCHLDNQVDNYQLDYLVTLPDERRRRDQFSGVFRNVPEN